MNKLLSMSLACSLALVATQALAAQRCTQQVASNIDNNCHTVKIITANKKDVTCSSIELTLLPNGPGIILPVKQVYQNKHLYQTSLKLVSQMAGVGYLNDYKKLKTTYTCNGHLYTDVTNLKVKTFKYGDAKYKFYGKTEPNREIVRLQ